MTPDEAVERYRKTLLDHRLTGDVPPEVLASDFRNAVKSCEDAIRYAREQLRFVRVLRDHRCEWNEDAYCNICGADGCA